MTPIQPPPGTPTPKQNHQRRRRDLSIPIPQRDPFPLPPTSKSTPEPSHNSGPTHQFSFSELDRVNQIASCSSGTIYTVIHRSTGQLFALKVIHGNHEDSVRRQIFREIEILRDVDHPNVVKFYDVFDHNSEIQVLLEYMNGGSLEGKHITDENQLSDIAHQILCGLTYLHQRRFVHRNIEPSNILIDVFNNVKIADFGVSKIMVQMMDPVSTIGYMSPERINTDLNFGQYDGYAGDIWGFGVSILEFYLGRFPFAVDRQGDWVSLMNAICMSKLPEAPPSASREFRDFIGCCLQRDPMRRLRAEQLLQHPFILRKLKAFL